MTFEAFKKIINDGIKSGSIKVSQELTELDLAIQFAIGREMETTGKDTFSPEDIYYLVLKWCGKETCDRVLPREA